MLKFGCTKKFRKILKSLYEGMLGRVNIEGEFSEPYPVTNGVRQRCIAGLILFNLFYAAMLSETIKDLPCGVYIRFRTSGKFRAGCEHLPKSLSKYFTSFYTQMTAPSKLTAS